MCMMVMNDIHDNEHESIQATDDDSDDELDYVHDQINDLVQLNVYMNKKLTMLEERRYQDNLFYCLGFLCIELSVSILFLYVAHITRARGSVGKT
jgi:hypothetical protein